MKTIQVCVALALFVIGCASKGEEKPRADDSTPAEAPDVAAEGGEYDLGAPAASFALPTELSEISGLTVLADGRLGAVQDEEGIVFILNPETGAIEKRIPFAGTGDYEGIERVDDRLFVLKSNGELLEISGWDSTNPSVETIDTGLKGKNDTEGLAYDAANSRLLIACKEDAGEGLDKDQRAVYAFDMNSGQLGSSPAIALDANDLKDRLSGKGQFRPSAVAVHPGSGEVYVLSSVVKGIAVIAANGELDRVHALPEAAFEQPEGLAFSASGELYISSEGLDGPGMLYKFRPRP